MVSCFASILRARGSKCRSYFCHIIEDSDDGVQAQGHAAGRPLFEALLGHAEGVLHPMHVSAFDSLMPLVNCCRATGDGAGAVKHLTRMLDAMDTVCGLPTVEVCYSLT